MSRYRKRGGVEPIINAAAHWKRAALLNQGSVLSDEALWTAENVESIQKYFVDNLDYGDGNFMTKLEGQLEQAPPSARRLMAEMMWVMLLCPSNIGPDNKRDTVTAIWNWSGKPCPQDSEWLQDEVLTGIGSAGTAFNTLRWREVCFFVGFLRAFYSLSKDRQLALLADGWALAEWMVDLPEVEKRQLRPMLLYLLFPDEFERIFGGTDRRRIVVAFTGKSKSQVSHLPVLELDRELLRIRREQEVKHSTTELDFYEEPLRGLWNRSQLGRQLDEISYENVVAAISEIEGDGVPDDARSSTYDLVWDKERFPPKYVLSVAHRYATGEELDRSTFSGGDASPGFKRLRDLGFQIERKDFVRDLLARFLAQADEGQSLAVSEFPDGYRDLKINVSFGKGNFAKIPWISFTGYEQTTSNGIYPGLLYYKSLGLLVVAYGISETNAPKVAWKLSQNAQTITAYLKEHHSTSPDRYGSSFVAQAFPLEEGADYDAIQAVLDRVIGQYHEQLGDKTGGATPGGDEPPAYGVEDAMEGLFMPQEQLEELLGLLELKKNVILQGPPGVGKTFLCKRLAYALMGEKAKNRLEMVQFHQTYAYEDFIQGYRPSGTGFQLKNGRFFEFCRRAADDPAEKYVFIIDEINRGNLSKVFGELMMLIESDKRGPDWAIPLTYSSGTDERFYIPENLYLIGLMNTADRSLAMVDYALRRRFAFIDLEPGFESDAFRQYLADKGAEPSFAEALIYKISKVNTAIAEDKANLGAGFRIGHSFFCAIAEDRIPDQDWYNQIINTEIAPLLREYWFDDASQADSMIRDLLMSE